VPDLQVRTAHGRGQPGPAGQLAGTGKPGNVADLGHHDQRGELPDPGQRSEHLDPRVGLGMLVQLAVDPVDQYCQGVDDRQAVGDDLSRRRRQVQLGQPAAARPGPVAGRPVIAVVGSHRVDPVAQLGTQPDQAGPVPQHGAELAYCLRGATLIDTGNGRAPVAQRGKAKQKRSDLRLVGLGLVVTRDGGIPLTSLGYPSEGLPGSRTCCLCAIRGYLCLTWCGCGERRGGPEWSGSVTEITDAPEVPPATAALTATVQ
jgi:hypothetical protein